VLELESLREKLEAILKRTVTLEDAVRAAGQGTPSAGQGTTAAEREAAASERETTSATFDAGAKRLVVRGELSKAERELVALLLEQGKYAEKKGRPAVPDDERLSWELSEWLLQRLESGDLEARPPEPFASWNALSGTKVPLLLYGDYPERQAQTSYAELRKLLASFFEGDVTLVPFGEQRWLILSDVSLLADAKDGNEETPEESISGLAFALHDMAASEWMGECHVAATYPIGADALAKTAAELRRTIELGRSFRLATNIHLPWELKLESLLDAVPTADKLRFIEGVLRKAEPAFDAEMMQTLEAFFSENCNVSDTAKRLYIHRNTLLYRLDKFKQETGMDVRGFEHAVLVRLAMLLYKVTKRK